MSENNGVFVSVHIRRSEFAERPEKDLQGHMVSRLFLKEALDWFRKKVVLYIKICKLCPRAKY